MTKQEELGKYLRVLRKRLPGSVSQKKVASQMDVGPSYICHLEKGRRGATPELLLRLAPILRVDKALLLIHAGYLELPGLRKEDLSQPKEEQLRMLWAKLNSEDRQEFLSHARYLLVRRQFIEAVETEPAWEGDGESAKPRRSARI